MMGRPNLALSTPDYVLFTIALSNDLRMNKNKVKRGCIDISSDRENNIFASAEI